MDAAVPGFRPGKAPRKIIERRFHKEVSDQVKAEVLLASLEQLAEEHDVAPLSPPNIDPAKIEIPKEGPFDLRVRRRGPAGVRPAQLQGPQAASGPCTTFTDDDVAKEERRILSRYGQLVPKEEGDAQIGDYVIADVTTRVGDQVIGTLKEIALPRRRPPGLQGRRGRELRRAGRGRQGRRQARRSTSPVRRAWPMPQLRGQTVQATLDIKDVKKCGCRS